MTKFIDLDYQAPNPTLSKVLTASHGMKRLSSIYLQQDGAYRERDEDPYQHIVYHVNGELHCILDVPPRWQEATVSTTVVMVPAELGTVTRSSSSFALSRPVSTDHS